LEICDLCINLHHLHGQLPQLNAINNSRRRHNFYIFSAQRYEQIKQMPHLIKICFYIYGSN
jgi:hypothetical protein